MKSTALAALLLLTALAPGQVLERTISLCDTFGWLEGEQSFAYDTRRQLAYVCASEDSSLFVLDGTTNAKKARIPVPFGITGIVYDSIDDRLFCARGEVDSVVVLDCRTLSAVAAVPVGNVPKSIHYADRVNKAYTVNEGDSTISVLDCGRVAELARLPANPYFAEPLYNRATNTLWLYDIDGEDHLSVVDCVGDSMVAEIHVEREVWGLDCDQLAGTMYCVDGSGEVLVIDGAGFQVRERIAPDGDVWGVVCAWQRGRLYLFGDIVEVYDYRAGEVVDTIQCRPDVYDVLPRYVPEADVIWLTCPGCWCGLGYVTVIDCSTNEAFQGPGVYSPLGLHPAPNGQTYLCSDDEPMFILKDARQMFAGVVTDGFYPHLVTCNPMDGMVYASGDPPTVVVVDPLLGTFFAYPGIDRLSTSYLNSACNKLYGWNLMSHTICTDLVVFDGVERRVSGMVKTGGDPSALCVNAVEDKVYCGSSVGKDVRVYDGRSDSMLACIDLGYPISALGLAVIENKLYCGGNTDAVAVIDCGGDSVTGKVYVPRVEGEFCYSPTAHRMYYLTDYGRKLEAIDCHTDKEVSSIRLPGRGSSMYLNARESKLYVTLPHTRHVAVIDCAADTIVADIAVGAETTYSHMEACFDAQGNKLYCSITAEDGVAVIDCKGDSLIMKLATGRSPVGVAFDPCTGRLFVANADDGSISVIRCPIPVANRSGDLERIPTLARGRLIIPAPHSGQLLDITGRVVLALRSGLNDVSRLSPGVYFVREAQAVRKVVITR